MNTRVRPIDILAFLTDEDVAVARVNIVDVGATNVGEAEPRARLVRQGRACLIGFEPNGAECERLNARAALRSTPWSASARAPTAR